MAKQSNRVPIQQHGENKVFHPLMVLRGEVDHIFDRFAEGWHHLRSAVSKPLADVSESKKDYEISIELPGMDENDIEVTMGDGVLYLSGEKKHEYEEKDREYYLLERAYGSFRRAFQIPVDVDSSKIDAKFTKGVLKVTFPRTKGAKARAKKIRVKAV